VSARPYDRPEYAVWCTMKQRCGNPRATNYASYGGRGIRVCDRWVRSFADFIEDMGSRPSSDHSIDRIDTNGNYEPGNCRWATRSEQQQNQRKSFAVRGLSQTVEFDCSVCGARVTRDRKRAARSTTCSHRCAGIKAGKASGVSRAAVCASRGIATVDAVFGTALTALAVAFVLLAAYLWEASSCADRARLTGLPHHYGITGGCMIQRGEHWFPIESVRDIWGEP
jgi:hypothetical protein